MTSLIACLSTGKGTWSEVSAIIKSAEWDSIYLITNSFGKEKFVSNEKTSLIVLDFNKSTDILSDEIVAGLHGKNLGLEVAINLSSGNGKEHMALLSAVLKLGLGIRFIFIKNDKVEELSLFN
jgi:hypothetical protein